MQIKAWCLLASLLPACAAPPPEFEPAELKPPQKLGVAQGGVMQNAEFLFCADEACPTRTRKVLSEAKSIQGQTDSKRE
jgi:hypothetical protein